ncbi:hypothetical protein BDZ45DRAFT_697058 [Acephala macrosclerotiorum]|nr:hypothetical protein BDZ45DRAFT_697058 [Acephala macrosclerotiorum]
MVNSPFATTEMVNSLLKMAEFPPRQVDTKEFSSRQGEFHKRQNLEIRPLEISRYPENLLSMIETFLGNDVDPTFSLSYIPKGFVFQKKILQNTKLEEATRAEIKVQESSQKQASKKRKLVDALLTEMINIVDVSDSEDVVFLEGRPVLGDGDREDDVWLSGRVVARVCTRTDYQQVKGSTKLRARTFRAKLNTIVFESEGRKPASGSLLTLQLELIASHF